MDSLIKSLRTFVVTNDSDRFNDSLDSVINQLSSLQTSDPDLEWEILCKNYSKLRYLKHTLDKHHLNLGEHEKFNISLRIYMETIDKQNQYYLKEINWEISENNEAKLIKKYLENSLNLAGIEKLKEVLMGYHLLVHIVEKMRESKEPLEKESQESQESENFFSKRQKI